MAQGIDVRERLVQHYRDHYSANLMRLVVVSDHSLDTLTEMTVGLFSPLSSSNRVPFICQQGSPMSANWLKHMVCVRSLREEQQLTILFQLSEYVCSLALPCAINRFDLQHAANGTTFATSH